MKIGDLVRFRPEFNGEMFAGKVGIIIGGRPLWSPFPEGGIDLNAKEPEWIVHCEGRRHSVVESSLEVISEQQISDDESPNECG